MDSSTTFGDIDFRPSQRRNELFLRGRRRPPLASSFSSHDSSGSGGGGKLKIRTSSGISCRTDPLRSGGRKPPGKERHHTELLLGSHLLSLPVIRSRQARHPRSDAKGTTSLSSNKNEEWDLSTTQTMARDLNRSRMFSLHEPIRPPAQNDLLKPSRCVESSESGHLDPRASDVIAQPKMLQSCLKKGTRTRGKKEEAHRVAFATTHDKCIGNSHMEDGELWYVLADHDRFLTDATVRAGLTDRTMRYVAGTERTYNSSTGLVAPQVLQEYLSIPEEIIGLEHLLAAQKNVRESLKSHHTKALLREQDRQRREGRCNAHSLAESVGSSSTIAAYMAQERASFVSLV